MLARCAALLVLAAVPVLAREISLTRVGEEWQYLAGLSEVSNPARAWREPSFDDRHWLVGRSGFSAGYISSEATLLPPPLPDYSSVYFRRTFDLTNAAQVKWLTLRVDYSDGFVAYLNGHEIARRNLAGAPGSFVSYSQTATNFHYRGEAEEINVTPFANALVSGPNTLAVQLHNELTGSAGLAFSAELMANFNRAPYLQNMSSNRVQIIWKTPVASDTTLAFGVGAELTSTLLQPELVTTHVVTLTNLLQDTLYSYRASSSAGMESVSAPVTSFRTFRGAGPVTFMAIGDAGWNSAHQYQLAGLLRRGQPDFVIETGDNVYPSFTEQLVDLRCFSVFQEHMAQSPYFFALGNHDLYSGVNSYLESLYLPTNSVALADHAMAGTSPEHYYSFDQGDLHVTVLFVPFISQYQLRVGDAQYQWLVNDLASTRQPWKIVVWHVPMSSSSGHRFDDFNFNGVADRLEIRDALLPVLTQYGVQLVLSGHEHGYERFNPTNGVHAITTAGGGAELYSFTELDVASALFWAQHNCVRVSIAGETLEAQALDADGNVFDALTIRRASAAPALYQATWHSPLIGPAGPSDGVGNIVGQTFDFRGEAIPAMTGQFSNLGRAYVNNDRTNLYVGLERVMIYGNNNIFLFVQSSRTDGVTSLMGLGNGLIDPEGQGADGLDFLSNLSFTNFTPSVGCILGDQLADGQFRSFARTNLALNIGQGAFHLAPGLPDVAGLRLQQFQRSPQIAGLPHAQNAGVIALAIPLAELGGLRPGDHIRIGAVVAAEFGLTSGTRAIDTGFLGAGLIGKGLDPVLLEGLEVQLALDPYPDLPGELRVEFQVQPSGKLRIQWPSVQGYRYRVEAAPAISGQFEQVGTDLILASPQTHLSFEVDLTEPIARAMFYRVRAMP